MKHLLCVLAVVFLASCQKTILGDQIPIYRELFYDAFQRPDTRPGDIGQPPLGGNYTLLGRGVTAGTATSYIKDKRLVTESDNDLYAIQECSETVNIAVATVRWDNDKGLEGDGVFIVLFSQMGGVNIAWDAIHIQATRFGQSFDVFNRAPLEQIEYQPYDKPLEIGKDYTFTYTVSGVTIFYTIESQGETIVKDKVSNPKFLNKAGKFICYEAYYNQWLKSTKTSIKKISVGTTL